MTSIPRPSEIPYELLMAIQRGTMEYRYRGIPLLKNPFDLALYPLLLGRARPRTLIEIGSYQGGSAIWFADQARALELDMHVVSVDLVAPAPASDASVSFLRGDARNLAETLTTRMMEEFDRPLLVIEDSCHLASVTAAVLDFFDPWMRQGEYIVIEDGILSDMRVADQYEGGPARAIAEFLEKRPGCYEIDRTLCDYFGRNVTWNVDGYLRRV